MIMEVLYGDQSKTLEVFLFCRKIAGGYEVD